MKSMSEISRQAAAARALRAAGLCHRCGGVADCDNTGRARSRCPDCRAMERLRDKRRNTRSRILGRPRADD
jgi:predicted Zn-ribbon and HTH transcriptional regulator